MYSFIHPALLWGLAILAAPILIHLINLLRHRRVRWAAMEFLLVSQKKHSTWVRLKELLLLLLRMAAIAAIVLLVAQPVLRHRWAELFGGGKTHHIVLLDDSFSTGDRWADTNALDEGQRFVERLAAQAAGRGSSQAFTLLRFSRVARADRGTQPDLLEELVGVDFAVRVADALRGMVSTESAAGPAQALEAIDQLLGDDDDETRIVYLVSDLRAREWREPAGLARQLSRLNAAGAQIRLVHTVETHRPNLSLALLQPAPGMRAAGVQMNMEVAVENHGPSAVHGVTVLLEEDGQARPAIVIDTIAAGKRETRRFPVNFPAAGQHAVTARLEGDNVDADNRRFALVDVPVAVPVLIVDGSADALDAGILSVALSPGGAVKTGISPRTVAPAWLNTHSLDEFQAIYLCNIERLDQPAIDRLEAYVMAGGGLAMFLGPGTDPRFMNEKLYRDGQGLFPLPLVGPSELLVDRVEPAPDLEVSDHPVFRIFSGERNSFLGSVKIGRYLAVPRDWKPAPDSPASLIARLRNGSPLALDHAFGEGRVVVFLTTAAPTWNNWARNPSFVVAMLELQSYLVAQRDADPSRLVGVPWQLELDPARYQRSVRFTRPNADRASRDPGESAPVEATVTPAGLLASLSDTDLAGVYQARLQPTAAAAEEVRQVAYNVLPEEGDLTTVSGEQLAAALPDVKFDYLQAAAFQESGSSEQEGFRLADAILYALVLLLVGEQLLAYLCSYHSGAKGGSRA
jgi:hypothetical protein